MILDSVVAVPTFKGLDGAPGTSTVQGGAGPDVTLTGGDAGADNGAGGNHGGNLFIKGGQQTFNSGQSGYGEQGSVIIGETTTDEIRLGHDPVPGSMDFGHILFRGRICPNYLEGVAGGGTTPQPDWSSLKFEANSYPANVTTDSGVPGQGATGIRMFPGKPVASTTALDGKDTTISGGAGSDGTNTIAAGSGKHLYLLAGAPGTNNGGGAGNSGNVYVDAVPGAGGSLTGLVCLGINDAKEIRIGNSGSDLGFFGVSPAAKQSVAADTLANLYTALRAYGLIA